VTVKAGVPVTIDAGKTVNDVHDIAIGPDAYMGDLARNLFQPGPSGLSLDARGIFPSQSPAQPLTFDGTQNGGFFSTGALDTDAKSPLPSKVTVTFTKPGTYHYVCLFHSDGVYRPGAENMQGTITVQ
jgi:plastocyanin